MTTNTLNGTLSFDHHGDLLLRITSPIPPETPPGLRVGDLVRTKGGEVLRITRVIWPIEDASSLLIARLKVGDDTPE